MDLKNPPERYWRVFAANSKEYAVANDLTFAGLERTVVKPWLAGRSFTISGMFVRATSDVSEIRTMHTPQPQSAYADEHNARMRASGISDLATDRKLLPFSRGADVTFALLFEGAPEPEPAETWLWFSGFVIPSARSSVPSR